MSEDAEIWTGARLRGAPVSIRCALFTVEILAVGLTALGLITTTPTASVLVRFGVLCALCVAFEEISRQSARMRFLISSGPLSDLTSVWTFAAALALPVGYGALFAGVAAVVAWTLRQRSAGMRPYLAFYSHATVVLAVIASAAARDRVEDWLGVPSAFAVLGGVLVATLLYTMVNRGLIVLMARLLNPGAAIGIVGSWSDNVLELSTLCLGALTGVVLIHEPALCVLVLLPMVLLQRGALVKELETAATIDGKTGLLNAAAWEEGARRELSRLESAEAPAAVLLIDLDFFKAVNDTYGHLAGDVALQAVGKRLTAELRQSDVLGRFGGEEFVALLPRIARAEAMAAAERIRAAIGTITLSEFAPEAAVENPDTVRLSASIGLALYPEHGNDLQELLRASDSALYEAKRSGRDQVVVTRRGTDGTDGA